MKKGDIIAKDVIVEQGTVLASNYDDEETAQSYLRKERLNATVVPDPEHPGKFLVVAKNTQSNAVKAHVMWVEDGTASIEYLVSLGSYSLINLEEEPEWKVIQESAPSYQSSVASMSEEELRASIESLRSQRASMPTGAKSKARKVSVPSMSAEDKLMLQKLAKIDPAKLAMLKEKLK